MVVFYRFWTSDQILSLKMTLGTFFLRWERLDLFPTENCYNVNGARIIFKRTFRKIVRAKPGLRRKAKITIWANNLLPLFFSGSPDQSCFAFTCAHTDPATKKTVFQCHVFRCLVVEAVTKVFVSFAQAFKKKNEHSASGPNTQ